MGADHSRTFWKRGLFGLAYSGYFALVVSLGALAGAPEVACAQGGCYASCPRGVPFVTTSLGKQTTQSPTAHEEIPSPQGWVPFVADGAIQSVERGIDIVGRHYRSSDGSERWEQGWPTVEYISIRNIAEATFYEWHSRDPDTWRAHPMDLPEGGWRPMRFAKGRAGLTAVETSIEGIRVLQQIDASGREAWLAPSLNFFTVKVTKSPVLQTLQTYSNFQLVEPDAELFVPPAGAVVTRSSTPRGIVSSLP